MKMKILFALVVSVAVFAIFAITYFGEKKEKDFVNETLKEYEQQVKMNKQKDDKAVFSNFENSEDINNELLNSNCLEEENNSSLTTASARMFQKH